MLRQQAHKRSSIAGKRIVLFGSSAADVVDHVADSSAVPDDSVDALAVDRYCQNLPAVFRDLHPPRYALEAVWDTERRRRLDDLQSKLSTVGYTRFSKRYGGGSKTQKD